MRGDIGLHEEHGPVGNDATCDDIGGHLPHAPAHLGPFVGPGNRVVVDDAVKTLIIRWESDPIANGAKVVAKVQLV